MAAATATADPGQHGRPSTRLSGGGPFGKPGAPLPLPVADQIGGQRLSAQPSTVVDGLDGFSFDHETVRFELDGNSYEIVLSAANASRLRAELQPWIDAARRTGDRRRRRRPINAMPPRASAEEHRAAIRAWARLNGYGVAVHGRIPRHVVDAYTAACVGEPLLPSRWAILGVCGPSGKVRSPSAW
ncbi:histone-like nucleoid-structuring protein Lsr2 [Mycolicibacterium baixiangningiae]|uniref:histone-like nucleoid-structuring protein Lsr2 n=1 Tax=Mycolicibacterium baixiangningiae TaxID=2761578 RepID=UPI0018D12EEB